MSLVTVSADSVEYKDCSAGYYYVKYSNGTHRCESSFTNAVNSINANETAEIVFLADIPSWTGDVVIDNNKNVTLNLNEYKATFSGGATGTLKVAGANVTIKNGTINAANQRIIVDASTKATTLTFANDVTVNYGWKQDSVVLVTDATKKTVININGTWNVADEIVNCAQKAEEELTVNLNAKVTATDLANNDALLVLDAGNTVVNVNGGTYKSNEEVFKLQNGTLNINGGTLESTDDTVVWVYDEPGKNLSQVLNINGGTLTAKKGYAVWFDAKEGTYKITDGTFKSGKDADGEQLPALYINTAVKGFLDNHKGMITKGTFTGSIVGEVTDKDGRHVDAEKAAADLVGNATVSEKDGVVTVGGIYKSKNHIYNL